MSSDDSLFYCNICNKNYFCSSHVSRHINSAYHKQCIKENIVYDNNNGISDVKHKQVQKKFRSQWLAIEDFKL